MGIKIVVQIPLLVLLARYLGPASYGEFAGLTALGAGLGTLAACGTGFLVLAESSRDNKKGQDILAATFPVIILASLLLIPTYLFLSWHALQVDTDLTTLLLIGVTELTIVPVILVLCQRTQGVGRVVRAQGFFLLPTAIRLVGLGACILIDPDGAVYTYSIAYAVASLVALVLIARVTQAPVFRPKSYRTPSFALVRRALPFAVMRFTNQSPSELDKSLALRVLSPADAGLYSIASRGVVIAIRPAVAIITASQPKLFFLLNHDKDAAIRLIYAVLGSAFGIGVTAGLAIYLLAPPVFHFLLGSDFSPIGDLIYIFAWLTPFMAVRLAAGGIFVALEKPLARTLVEGIGLAIIFIVGVTLGLLHGLAGLITSILISEALMAVVMVTLIFKYRHTSLSQIA